MEGLACTLWRGTFLKKLKHFQVSFFVSAKKDNCKEERYSWERRNQFKRFWSQVDVSLEYIWLTNDTRLFEQKCLHFFFSHRHHDDDDEKYDSLMIPMTTQKRRQESFDRNDTKMNKIVWKMTRDHHQDDDERTRNTKYCRECLHSLDTCCFHLQKWMAFGDSI